MFAAGVSVMAWTLADTKPHARSRDPDRRVLRRALPRLHVLPWRARAVEAGAEIPDALLPDGVARRRSRLRIGRHRRPARSASRLRACGRARRRRDAPSLAGASRSPRLRRARRRRAGNDDRLHDMVDQRVLRTHDRREPQFLRRAARAALRPERLHLPPLADPRHDRPRHAIPVARLAHATDDAITRRPPASAACSNRCIRASRRSRSA